MMKKTEFTPGQETDRPAREVAAASALGDLSLGARRILDLHLRDDYIRLGQRKFPYRLPYEKTDYADYRRGFIKVLADNQAPAGEPHEPMTPRAVWAEMGEEGRFPLDLMLGIKRWRPTLTFRREPWVVSNGLRGRGATYSVNQDFHLRLNEKPEVAGFAIPELPDSGEIYEAVRHLTQFDFVMREYDIEELEPELEMALQANKADYSKIRAGGQDIRDYRGQALDKLELVLNDQDYRARYKESLEKGTPEYGFLRYIFDLRPQERFFLSRLINATVEPHTVGGELRLEAVDEKGMLIAVVTPKGVTEAADIEESGKKPPASTTYAPLMPAKQKLEFKNELEEAMVGLIEDVARSTAIAFLERFRADKVYTPDHLKAAFPKLRKELIVSARDNNVLPRNQQRTSKGSVALSFRETIRVMLYSDSYLQNMVTARKYRKQIEAIINRVIEEEVLAAERVLSGENEDY